MGEGRGGEGVAGGEGCTKLASEAYFNNRLRGRGLEERGRVSGWKCKGECKCEGECKYESECGGQCKCVCVCVCVCGGVQVCGRVQVCGCKGKGQCR